MKLSINTKYPNYAAKIVKISQLEKHPNADKLQIAVSDFQRIITGLETKVGDLFVHFPAESQINLEFLSFENLFRKKELNQDKSGEKIGFFEESGRVKSIKLRGIISEGYLHPIGRVNAWLESLGVKEKITEEHLGEEFDTISTKGSDDIFFTKKYFIRQGRKDGTQKLYSGESRLVEGQFHLHSETKQIKRNMGRIFPDEIISISYKLHGSNGIFSNILVKRKLSWWEKVVKFFGAKIVESEYDLVWSSRRVVKNRVAGQELSQDDVWNCAAKNLKDKVAPGISLYCEVVGEQPTGKQIQKDFDYGCEPCQHEVYVFRITHTDIFGTVREFNTKQIEKYCERYNLKVCPVFYYGKAKHFCDNSEFASDEDGLRDWREQFLEKAQKEFTEKDCFMCKNKVPEEGVVIRKDEEKVFEAFKLKSLRFLEKETKFLDKGETSEEEE